MQIKLIAILLILIPAALFAINSNAGEFGFQFLQIPVNPVAAALAGKGIYSTNYSGAFLNNPAANLMDERFSLSLQHTLWLVETNYTQLIYSNGKRDRHFGLAARILDYGKIDTRDDTGLIIGEYEPLDANLLANMAVRLFPDHLVGINAGIIYEKISTASSYGFNADLGYIFLTPLTNTIVFASIRNLGLTTKMDEESIRLPITMETGAGYVYELDDYRISSQLTVNKAQDTDFRAAFASELSYMQSFMLRTGYKFNYDEENLTAGFGLSWRSVDIDYGWTGNTKRLNDTHSFGITYNF